MPAVAKKMLLIKAMKEERKAGEERQRKKEREKPVKRKVSSRC